MTLQEKQRIYSDSQTPPSVQPQIFHAVQSQHPNAFINTGEGRKLDNQKKSKFTSSNLMMTILLILSLLVCHAKSFTLSITSSETQTGVLSNYFFTINNHNNPTNLILTFSDWSPTLEEPFISTYRIVENTTGNGLTCIKRFRKIVECNINTTVFSGTGYPSRIVLRMSGIYNPSSTKPYLITLLLNGTSGSQTQPANLTVTQPRVSSFFIDNYSTQIGRKSSALVYLTFRNYFSASTILNITYNGALVVIDMIPDSSYSILRDSISLKKITSWNPVNEALRTLRMNITNPSFALQYTIEGMLYFIENGIEYRIERYTLSVELTPLSYSSFGMVSPQNNLKMGSSTNTLSMFSQCSIQAIKGPSGTTTYYEISYDNTILNFQSGSTCTPKSTNGSTSTCVLSIPNNAAMSNNSFLLTRIAQIIPLNSVLSTTMIRVTSWSYFSTLAQFYSICSSQLTVSIIPQPINPSTVLSSCNQITGQSNTLTFSFSVQNAAISDVLVLRSNSGNIVNRAGSIPVSFNSALNQYQASLTTSQIINSTNVQFTVSFTNPTFIPSQQPSVRIQLSRRLSPNNSSLNMYAQTSSAVNICPVNTPLSNSTNNILSLSNIGTYGKNVTYYVQFGSASIQFKDYKLNDYLLVNFKNKVSHGGSFAQTDSPFQLNNFHQNSTPSVKLNTQFNLLSQIISSSILKITLNSTQVINIINNINTSSLLLTINSLSNPFFVSDSFCLIRTFTVDNLEKENILTSTQQIVVVRNTQISLFTNSLITLLYSNNTINLRITSISQKSLLKASYPFISSLFFILRAPFMCANTNSSNELFFVLPSLTTTEINLTLSTCTLGYFTDYSQSIEIREFAKFSHSNLTQDIPTTTSLYPLKSTCGDKCYDCDTTTLKCFSCFNSTHSTFNYYYPLEGRCFESCPIRTFGNGFTCQRCHPLCSQCTNDLYTSCTRCTQNYVKNSNGICESRCGVNKFLSNGLCTDCNRNCQGCLNATFCYSCKNGAVQVGSMCMFVSCQAPCETCQGSVDYCLSCFSNSTHTYYFHDNTCVLSCPDNTFAWQDETNTINPRVCKDIESSSVYFVGVILSAIALAVGCIIRCFAPKKSKLQSLSLQQKDSLMKTSNKLNSKLSQTYGGQARGQSYLSKTQQTENQDPDNIVQTILNKFLQANKNKIYKLNLLRFMTVLMAYFEVICAIIILVKGGIYNPTGVNELIFIGLAGLVITNIIFGVRYFLKVYRRMSPKRQKFIQTNINKLPEVIEIEPTVNEPNVQQNIDINEESIGKQRSENVQKLNTQFQMSEKSSEHQKPLTEEEKQKLRLNKKLLSDYDNEMVKQIFTAVMSTIFTLRTYNILRSNLFILFQSPNQNLKSTKIQNSNKMIEQTLGSFSALNLPQRQTNEVEIKKTELMVSKRNLPLKKGTKEGELNQIKIAPRESKLDVQKRNVDKTLRSSEKNMNQASLKNTNIFQAENLVSSFRPFSLPSEIENPLISMKNQYVSRFLHPFYTYIMFASLAFVSLMFAIASAITVVNGRYENMMIWGIDALVVIGVGFLLNIFDLWKAVNLSRHEQNSEISTEKNEINQTMENLKNDEDYLDKIDLNNQQQIVSDMKATKKINSTLKKKNSNALQFSPSKNKIDLKTSIKEDEIEIRSFSKSISPKSPSLKSDKTKAFGSKRKNSIKSSDGITYAEQKPPQLKIFDDLQIQDNPTNSDATKFSKAEKLPRQNITNRQSMKERLSNKTLYGRKTEMSSKLQPQTTRAAKSKGFKMDDIYLGFLQNEKREQHVNQQVHQDITETDEIDTVKLQGKELILESVKKPSNININTFSQADQNQFKLKPLEIIENDRDEEIKQENLNKK